MNITIDQPAMEAMARNMEPVALALSDLLENEESNNLFGAIGKLSTMDFSQPQACE